MRDNQLINLIRTTIIAQEAIAGISGTPIKAAFQPTQQGINKEPTAYMFKVGDKTVGSPRREDVWDQVNSIEVHTEMQIYETTFQITALATQVPVADDANAIAEYTASDILNLIRYILQSSQTIETLRAQDVGILRILQVQNTPFLDDRHRHEFQPSLDFIVTHKQIVASSVPVLQSTEFQIIEV